MKIDNHVSKELVAMGCVLVVGLGVSACNQSGTYREPNTRTAEPVTGTAPATTPGAMAGTTRVADIVSSPAAYNGKTVTIVADVDHVYGPKAFTLDEDAPLAGGIDNDLIVISPQAGNLAAIQDNWANNKVRVTGTVRSYTPAELEREVGWDIDQSLEGEIGRRKAVIVASSIERVPGA